MGPRNTDRSEDDAVADDDASTDDDARKPGRMERVRTNVQSANVDPTKSDMSIKWAIDKVDEREKRFSFAAAGGAILFAVIIYLSETSNANFRLSKGELTPQTLLWIGIVAGVLLIGATVVGRRAPIGFVSLLTGAAFSGRFLFLGLPFFALAVWLLYRSYKIQRETAANLRAANAGNGPTRARSGGAASRGGTTKAPAKREANKRYTPPKPPPPAPKASRAKPAAPSKPSRKERKAALKDS